MPPSTYIGPPVTLQDHVARWIRVQRRRCKLSQTAFAQRLDVSQPTVSAWERGVTLPDWLQFVTLARCVQLNPADAMRDILDEHTRGAAAGPLFAFQGPPDQLTPREAAEASGLFAGLSDRAKGAA